MASKKICRSQKLSNPKIDEMFERFSFPLVRPCITPKQKKSAVGIAKTLWLRLVTGTDIEPIIYDDLRAIFKNNHESNISVGSLYFFQMKTALTELEIDYLKKHYEDERNIKQLESTV